MASAASRRWQFCVFFLALGCLFAYYAWSQASAHWALASHGQRAEALIVGYEEVRGRRSTTLYPSFQFATADGRRVQAASGVSGDPAAAPRGSRIAVLYDPAHPETVQQAAVVAGGLGITPWILGVMALAMFALGSIFLLPQRAKPAP